jgi:hypothetical protein
MSDESKEQPYYVNNRNEWKRNWTNGAAMNSNATYPLDGRETIYEPYEKYVRGTQTVGDYLDAYEHMHDPSLPDDYADYVLQRVLDLPVMVDPYKKIDRWGRIEGGYAQPSEDPEITTMLARVMDEAPDATTDED